MKTIFRDIESNYTIMIIDYEVELEKGIKLLNRDKLYTIKNKLEKDDEIVYYLVQEETDEVEDEYECKNANYWRD